ncbi:unnamed protein product [Camellia sinensis]
MVLLVAACRTCHLKERFRLNNVHKKVNCGGQPLFLQLNLFYGATVKQMALRQLISQHSSEIGATFMLDEWEENLAIITANRTKDDELVVIHLGDCLWKERGEECCVWILLRFVTAAHICYLVAEANCESYSDTARICLIGADHLKFPRIYASPEAIQRTELYEYSKVLGNPQFSLLPFQPYKLIYAHMLAELDIIWLLQNWWVNCSTCLIVLLIVLWVGFHRLCNEHDRQKVGPRVSNCQSTMAMSSLMPSASTESEWKGRNNQSMHNRSISEPDFGKTPRKQKASGAGGSSRLGRIGSQIFQNTVGLVLRSRSDRQATLGEKNKFYYDENLKRWLEEGAEPPGDEPALPPPPPSASLQNRTADYIGPKIDNLHSNSELEYKSPSSEWNFGILPTPPSSNHLSVHGRMGVRARYVDTFNKGGGTPANLFQSPSLLAAKSGAGPVGPNAKFFIPTLVASGDETVQKTGENLQEAVFTNESPSSFVENNSFPSPLTSTSTLSMPTMQRIPSMDNIVSKRSGAIANSRSSLPPHSRRTTSWSGCFFDHLPEIKNER